MAVDCKLMKIKTKNNQEQAFRLVHDIIRHSPEWDSMKIVVQVGNQKKNTYVSIK